MSGGEIMILGKLALTFGLLLGLPLWDLYKLRRELRREQEEAT
jgi:hypothetical protein